MPIKRILTTIAPTLTLFILCIQFQNCAPPVGNGLVLNSDRNADQDTDAELEPTPDATPAPAGIPTGPGATPTPAPATSPTACPFSGTIYRDDAASFSMYKQYVLPGCYLNQFIVSPECIYEAPSSTVQGVWLGYNESPGDGEARYSVCNDRGEYVGETPETNDARCGRYYKCP
jgi:hypothetical protein